MFYDDDLMCLNTYRESVGTLSKLKSCDSVQLSRLINKAKDAYGSVDKWTKATVSKSKFLINKRKLYIQNISVNSKIDYCIYE